jgi:hypothetical protein
MSDRATREQLDELHELLAHTLAAEIAAARNADAENKTGFASLLNVARAFLKDNDIKVGVADREERFGPLTKLVLPFAN